MAEDTEKKFQSIMNKLFSSSKSNRSLSSYGPSSEHNTRVQKRPYSAMELTSRGNKGEGISSLDQAPACRPWDRRDLVRRLATFKSMTWFAKPKAMDAVNCARRGWINIDMDIIACEVCGSRLQFSTPLSWSREQVEKAALVSNLKLDSGHKLLCPWLNNACDENLALFPPMPTPVLVDHYKERSSSLLQLYGLPVISASALGSMKTPQLEHFLKQSIAVECGEGYTISSCTEDLGNDVEAVSADNYYQAHRILSLCGWEPRLLPYTVDCSDQSQQRTDVADISSMFDAASSQNGNELCVYLSGSADRAKVNEDPSASGVHYDPNSTILECKLCGANIGLWAFTIVPRPLELIRFVGYESQENKISEIGNQADNERSDNTIKESKLNMTIAGGPSPAKQNFRARISLPVIGRNVRARFSYKLSQPKSTIEQELASDSAIEVGSVKTTESMEAGLKGTANLSVVEGDGILSQAACGSDISGKGRQEGTTTNELNSAILDSIPLRKETSSIADQEKNEGRDAETVLQKDVSSMSADMKSHFTDEKMGFHPIRQHRHFCPWIKSTDTTAAGWQQTLSALQKEKVFSLPESKNSPSSPSLIKVDDPITSIRRLFESPPAKKAKPISQLS